MHPLEYQYYPDSYVPHPPQPLRPRHFEFRIWTSLPWNYNPRTLEQEPLIPPSPPTPTLPRIRRQRREKVPRLAPLQTHARERGGATLEDTNRTREANNAYDGMERREGATRQTPGAGSTASVQKKAERPRRNTAPIRVVPKADGFSFECCQCQTAEEEVPQDDALGHEICLDEDPSDDDDDDDHHLPDALITGALTYVDDTYLLQAHIIDTNEKDKDNKDEEQEDHEEEDDQVAAVGTPANRTKKGYAAQIVVERSGTCTACEHVMCKRCYTSWWVDTEVAKGKRGGRRSKG